MVKEIGCIYIPSVNEYSWCISWTCAPVVVDWYV